MKKVVLTMMCLMAMLATGISLDAQEITITLYPGWNWISYPNAVSMNIGEALGDFTPQQGDIIKSRNNGTANYHGTMWFGSLRQFMPGCGYMYYSSRTENVELVFARVPSSFVTTTEPTNITSTSAVVGGTVTVPEGSHVFQRGVCWGTEPNPDIDGNHTSDGTIIGSFNDTLIGLAPGTTYYVRAYVVTDYGLAYGEEMNYITLGNSSNGGAPVGTINGLFTINGEGDQVYFSQGNLQYIGSANTPYWKFAENQWECLGTSTGQNSTAQNVDRDLFGWGTSGWDNGNLYYRPYDYVSHGYDNPFYGPVGNFDLTGDYANADWGVYNTISNGGSRQWRTLTAEELNYLLMERNTPSGIRFVKAIVAGVRGLVLLPDDWSASTYYLKSINSNLDYAANKITAGDWMDVLEPAGAVFLPAAGDRYQTASGESTVYYWNDDYYTSGCFGHYWTTTQGVGVDYATGLFFYGSEEGIYTPYMINDQLTRCEGNSVRLISVE